MFITFEGPEGCGKTTQIRMLSERLKNEGYDCVVTREPGGTALGKKIRGLLLDIDDKIYDRAELFLYAADRNQHVNQLIKPSLSAGKIVISDRFYHSTMAYQGAGRNIKKDVINTVIELAIEGVKPDLVFLMDIDPSEGFNRIGKSGRKKDRIEKENLEFHERVRKEYLNIAEKEKERFVVIDASEPINEIHEKIWEHVKKCL